MSRRLRILLLVALTPIFVVACGSTRTITDTVTRPLLGAPSAQTQAVPGHPCTPKNFYLQCLYNAAGQAPSSFPLPTLGFAARFGLDFAWGGPPASVAVRGGAAFAISYLSGTGKDWSYAALHSYLNYGRAVGFVWETTAGRALAGCAAGASDARYANLLLGRYGIPNSGLRAPAIFFAVDTDTSAAAVASYFSCAHSVLGNRTGAYGGFYVIAGLFNRGIIHYGWQTLAWSYGRWDRRAALEQTSINRSWYGYSVDFNRQIAPNTGLYPMAASPDPYRIYPRTNRRFPHRVRASEYNAVRTWDRSKCRNPVGRKVCRTTRRDLGLLSARVFSLATHDSHGRKRRPRWDQPTRQQPWGARYAGMTHRMNGR